MTDLATGPVFTDDYWREPFAVLGEVREQAPVREVELPEGGTTWLVTRYADARSVMADPRFVKDFRNSLPEDQRANVPGLPSPVGDMMLLNDPPVHTRLRKLVVKAFTVRRVAALRPRIETIAGALLAGLPAGEPVDLVDAYAVRLPTAVICELLGVPVEDQDAFGAWSRTMIDDSGEAATHQANASLAAYLSELVERKRAEPDEALISALIEVSEEGEQLSTSEIVAMGMLLLIAGHETTATLITTAVEAMLGDHALRDRLAAAESDELRAAIEEFLRWGSPIAQAPLRFAAEDVEFDGVVVPRRRDGDGVAGRRQPRPRALRAARRLRGAARHHRAPGVRPRPALLPRRVAGPAGGRGRASDAARPLPGVRRRVRRAARASPQRARQRLAAPAGGARPRGGRRVRLTARRDLPCDTLRRVSGGATAS